MEVEGSLPYS